jgi:hypothetical protein
VMESCVFIIRYAEAYASGANVHSSQLNKIKWGVIVLLMVISNASLTSLRL